MFSGLTLRILWFVLMLIRGYETKQHRIMVNLFMHGRFLRTIENVDMISELFSPLPLALFSLLTPKWRFLSSEMIINYGNCQDTSSSSKTDQGLINCIMFFIYIIKLMSRSLIGISVPPPFKRSWIRTSPL